MENLVRLIGSAVKHSAGVLLDAFGMKDAAKHYLMNLQEALGMGNVLGFDASACLEFQIHRVIANSRDIVRQSFDVGKPRVLFLDFHNGPFNLSLQSLLAYSLAQRGANCRIVICGGNLPKCRGTSCINPVLSCEDCHKRGRRFLTTFSVPYQGLDQFMQDGAVARAQKLVANLSPEQCANFHYAGLDVGKMIDVSVTKYFLRGRLELNNETLDVQRGYLATAIVLVDAYRRMLSALSPDVLLMLNGRYCVFRVACEVAREMGIDVITYEHIIDVGEGKKWFFTRFGPAIDTDLNHQWDRWREIALTDEENRKLDAYLFSRTRGTVYYPNPEEDKETICKTLDLERGDTIVSMFTNIAWDSAVIGKNIAFVDMFEWIEETIRYSADKEFTLIIRTHPVEVETLPSGYEPTLQKVRDEIRRVFPVLPKNVKVVPAESPISSYSLVDMSGLILVYTGTIGLEAAVRGRPVIVAGDTHYRGKGFTYDISTKKEYFSLLGRLIINKEPAKIAAEKARRYAYLYFVRSQIPLNPFSVSSPYVVSRLNINSLADLLPGRNEYWDLVCTAIMEKKDFILPRKGKQ